MLRHTSRPVVFIVTVLGVFLLLSPTNSLGQMDTQREKTFSYTRSMLGLQQSVVADLKIAKVIAKNVHMLQNNSYFRKASKQYLEDIHRGSGVNYRNKITKAQVLAIAKHPIASYRTLRRLVTLLPDLIWRTLGIFDILSDEVSKYLNKGLPHQADLNHAMDGILRLHVTYDLNIETFSNGNIFGAVNTSKLDAVHCYEIGLYGTESGKYYAQSVDWLELALNKIIIHNDKTIDKGIASAAFLKAVKIHDEAFKTDTSAGSVPYYFNKKIAAFMGNGDFSKRNQKTEPSLKGVFSNRVEERQGIPPKYVQAAYWGLCRGDNYQSLKEKSQLFCWLEFKAHQKFLIGPMKMELLARSPDIVQMYDVVGDKLIDRLKGLAENSSIISFLPGLEGNKAGSSAGAGTGAGTAVRRASKGQISAEITWLPLKVHADQVRPLQEAISHLTGLDTMRDGSSEDIQMSSHVFSGHYVPRLDSSLSAKDKGKDGNRIATMMIYFSDVEVGGYTAFPHLGVAARPVKGSALFWYNTLQSGQVDKSTLQGGCPVVIGHKHVANNWIRYNNQFITHTCSTNRLDRFQVAVNKRI